MLSPFRHLRINHGLITRNGVPLLHLSPADNAETAYRAFGFSYPKFFKMDVLSKWAWIGAELLLRNESGAVYDGQNKDRIAVVLSTANGCLGVDKRYRETLETVPSPALFVYTLPNIMLGEICIRHGFKGEQLCLVQPSFDTGETSFWVTDLLQRRGMESCLFGWVEAAGDQYDVCLFWADQSGKQSVTPQNLLSLYNERPAPE